MKSVKIGESFITCQNSQGTLLRGTIINITGQHAVFEVYNPFSLLQLSEVLTQVEVIIHDRKLYSGRAVVSNLVNTGIMLVAQVTLVDTWIGIDILSILENKSKLHIEIAKFIRDWRTGDALIEDFKILISDLRIFLTDLRLWLQQLELALEREDLKETKEASTELVDEVIGPVQYEMQAFLVRLEQIASSIDQRRSGVHKSFLRRELHPLVLCSPFIHRSFTKPLGYSGDYKMINMILNDPHEGNNIFAKTINTIILDVDVARAHRNRIEILTDMLIKEAALTRDSCKSFKVLNIACGPAREIIHFIHKSEDANRCELHLMDFSPEAINFVSEKIEDAKRDTHSSIHVVYTEKSVDILLRESINSSNDLSAYQNQFDVVYCAGLFDYLTDTVCERLMKLYYSWTKTGGSMLVTNVHSLNPQRYLMEYLLEWHIFHRNEKDLFKLSSPDWDTEIFPDETGTNVFLKTRKNA